MSLNPRRSAGALWLAWVVASALGGGLATLLSLAGLDAWLNDRDQFTFFAYETTFAVVAAVFQYLVLRLVPVGRRPAVLWLPATAVAINVYFVLNELWIGNLNELLAWLSGAFPSLDPGSALSVIFDAGNVIYAFALGAIQGLVLVLITGRKSALVIWLGGNLLGLLTSAYLPRLVTVTAQTGAELVASNAIFTGAYAVGTGVALVMILRLRRYAPAPPLPATVPTLQGQG